MKKFLLAAGLLAATTLSAKAQNDAPPVQREIGFGTNLILGPVFNSSNIPLDFIYKWGSDSRLTRLGTAVSFGSYTNLSSDLSSENYHQSLSSEVFIGKEWRLGVADRWLLNYGADINLNYSHELTENEYSNYNGNEVSIRDSNRRGFGAGVRPFIGILFQINQRLSVGTEASFQAGLQKFHQFAESYTLIDGQKSSEHFQDKEKAEGLNFNFRTQPASNIFVYYRF